MLKKCISVLLTLCIAFSMITVSASAVSVPKDNPPSGGFGIAVKNFSMNKICEIGLRTIAKITTKSLNALGDTTDVETFSKVASIINTVLFGGTGKQLGEIKALCEDILKEIEDLKADMDESFTVVERMLGEQAATTARNKQDEKWTSDVKNVIEAHDASFALDQYQVYMQAALEYSNAPESTSAKNKYEAEKEQLIQDFRLMYPGTIGIDVAGDPEKLKDVLFTSTSIDDEFIKLINELSANLVKGENSSRITLAETAAQTAYEYFPFSHQQYQFVHTVVGEQLMELSMCMLLASEFFDMQGEYILEKYGEGSSVHTGYVNVVNQYYDMVSGKPSSIENRINEMLDAEMTVGSSVSVSLYDYMKPEDAVSTSLNVQDYISEYKLCNEYGEQYGELVSSPVYINNGVRFNRLATTTAAGAEVFYMLDSSQFSDKNATLLSALDAKVDFTAQGDVHLTSCDYQNLIKKMSDGVNTFSAPSGSNMGALSSFFNTNAFNLSGKIPTTYLEGYLPSNDEVYILTSSYNNYADTKWTWATTYAHYYVIDAKAAQSGSTPETKEITGEIAQLDHDGEKRSYSIILSNEDSTYKQTARLKTTGNATPDVQIVSADSNITVQNGGSAVIPSGEKLSIRFQSGAHYVINSLTCVRNNGNDSGNTETILLDNSDAKAFTPGDDGYCTFTYSMPYSDATFVLDASLGEHDYDDNGFCKLCDQYQPAEYNSATGNYEVSNAGNLFWFAALVNGDKTKADFESQDTDANAVIVSTLFLENREWSPIKNFSGTFDGNNNIISGFKITDTSVDSGLFGNSSGTIKNFTLIGEITLSSGGDKIGSVIGYTDGATVSNVISSVNIKNTGGELHHVGGVIGYIENNETFVEKCAYYGTIDIKNSHDCIGGIAGYSNAGARISNCANHGSVSASKDGAYVGGILGYVNNSNPTVKDCYNYGKVSNGNSKTYCGAIIGWARNYTTSNIDNNYYLDSSSTLAFGSGGKTGVTATSKTADEFKSGEVAYLLNHSVTDGIQVWYQNIDNGETPNDYPVFNGGTVYYGYTCNKADEQYSNNKLDNNTTAHKFDKNGFCTNCGAYQPATLNSNGVYEIGNAGQLYWFSSLVNGDTTHAEFDAKNTSANAVLTADITVNSDLQTLLNEDGSVPAGTTVRSWMPIGNYSDYKTIYNGTFDGQGHTVSGLYFYGVISSTGTYVGLFGYNNNGTIKNVGVADSCFIGYNMVGGVCGRSYGIIENCYNSSKISGTQYVGGLCGNNFGTIKSCYNSGTVNGKTFVGGVCGCDLEGSITNCYYLDIGKSEGTTLNNYGTSKTEAEFNSGEVTYLLNEKVTDGSQVWYQNIDNGEIPDDYPKFVGGTVYYLEYKDTYSNFNSEEPDKPGEFDTDTDGNLIISTYDDLVKLSNLVRSDYDVYGSQNYIVTNNIKAPDDSEWTQGIGSVSDNKPFNGTFNGNGYCIIGLNVNSPEYGGLFEIIGKNGCVKDLFVFDCDFSSSSKTAGGIAAVNNGTIDHCTSGVNITSGTLHIHGKEIKAAELNSKIKGEIIGGIVGENSGSITGCRNASVILGTQCGGVAGVNTGTIYGCANNGKVGTTSSSVSGGLVGKNGGTIESSYNCADVNNSSENAKGSVAGKNGYDGLIPTVKNVYYITENINKKTIDAVGSDSTHTLDKTNIGSSDTSYLKSQEFTDALNLITDDSVVWKYNPPLNKGFPIIDGNFFINVVKSVGNNITLRGSMHKDLNISYDVCSENAEEYKLLSSSAGENKIKKTYSVSLTDKAGNYIPAELWCGSSCEISVPVDSDNIQLVGIDADGNVVYHKPDSVQNGIAVFTVSHPMSFAIVEASAKNVSSNNTSSKNNASAIKTVNDNTPIKTGVVVCSVVLFIAAVFSLALILSVKRRNRIG